MRTIGRDAAMNICKLCPFIHIQNGIYNLIITIEIAALFKIGMHNIAHDIFRPAVYCKISETLPRKMRMHIFMHFPVADIFANLELPRTCRKCIKAEIFIYLLGMRYSFSRLCKAQTSPIRIFQLRRILHLLH